MVIFPNKIKNQNHIAHVSPEAFKSFPKRWSAPEIRGKRIAIDATLMTNRFHFATSGDGDMKGKGTIVGWYNLISIMRVHGVTPIAIWDQPGKRPWKELESRKRLYTRAQGLARRSHEDDRLDRLHTLRDAILDFQALTREEQSVVQTHWMRTRFLPIYSDLIEPSFLTNTDLPRSSTPPSSSSTSKAEETVVPDPLENITSSIDTFTDILASYRRYVRLNSAKSAPVSDAALEYIRELEDLSEELGQSTSPSPASPIPPSDTSVQEAETASENELPLVSVSDEARRIVDDELEQILGTESFAESKTQAELTLEEGNIINTLLTPITSSSTVSLSSPPSTIQEEAEGLYNPLQRVNVLIDRSPSIRGIYERALNTPTAQHHIQCRELLAQMGVPVLLASSPFEAEGLASALAKNGLVDYVGTEDSDVIGYDAPLLKNVTTSRLPLVVVSPGILRRGTKLSTTSFLDFCVLCGTDASPRIPGIGPGNAIKLIEKYGSIEEVLEKEKGIKDKVEHSIPGGVKGWMELISNARELFQSLPPLNEEVLEGIKARSIDEGDLERWLEAKHGISLMEPGSEEEEQGEQSDPIAFMEDSKTEATVEDLPLESLNLRSEVNNQGTLTLTHQEQQELDQEEQVLSQNDLKDMEEAFKGDLTGRKE